jgi:hypothetical protein
MNSKENLVLTLYTTQHKFEDNWGEMELYSSQRLLTNTPTFYVLMFQHNILTNMQMGA